MALVISNDVVQLRFVLVKRHVGSLLLALLLFFDVVVGVEPGKNIASTTVGLHFLLESKLNFALVVSLRGAELEDSRFEVVRVNVDAI